jgi:hypothetical protein
MKIELNTSMIPLFSGTYGTFWDDFLDENQDNQGLHPRAEYEHKDLMESIASEYHNHETEIVRDMNIDWIKSIKFMGSWYSPREYNFKTDSLDFELEIDQPAMMQALAKLADNQEFKKYLTDNFSSRDGFWSFTPNNYEDLKEAIVSEGDRYDQAVSALITYLAEGLDGDFYQTIEGMIYEHFTSNGYGGLDYKFMYELKNKETGETQEYSDDDIVEMVNANGGAYDYENWLEGLDAIGYEYESNF